MKGTNRCQEACESRAWVQHRTGEDDWAGTQRYLNVVRCDIVAESSEAGLASMLVPCLDVGGVGLSAPTTDTHYLI